MRACELFRVIGLTLLLTAWTGPANGADFTLIEHVGHTWNNERVTFPLTPAQAAKAGQKLALVGPEGKEVAYQVVAGAKQGDSRVCFQADLPPLESREFSFGNRPAAAPTDLKIRETTGGLILENEFVGLAVRKALKEGQGPIGAVRLKSGKWTGGSTLDKVPTVKSYSAEVTARGPVFVEVLARVTFADEGTWSLRFQLERAEPVVLVHETFDAPSGGTFQVSLGNQDFRPTHLLFRAGSGGNMGRVNSHALAAGQAFSLQPWLQWWGPERQGNWFALYTAAPEKGPSIDQPGKPKENAADGLLTEKPKPDPHPDLLMLGLLRPSVWKDPRWSGKAPHVGTNIAAEFQDSRVTASFPLGGGNRVWMLGTPDKTKSLAPLADANRNVSPLPQRYLIKHGDFPLDEVKDYVLRWPGDHDNYPRLLLGKQELQTLRQTLKPNPTEVARWESQQPIDKYNIAGPLREFFASGSPRLGGNIVARADEWLRTGVKDAVIEQNSRVTLGVAPHMQAVLTLPALNLTDAALGVESLTPQQRQRFLAQLALLGYVVNRDDYWSPARGFAANPNMSTTVAQYQVTIASLLPSHPLAKQWAAKGLGTLRSQLYEWSDEDGGWLEAPHYAMVSYDHMLGAFLMASRADFANHLHEDRMRRVAEWFAKISTPPDARTGGFRHLPPIGNTYFGEPTGVFGIVAGVWRQRDPAFAAQMQWMCEQHGSPDLGLGWSFPAMTGYKELLKNHGVAATKPDYGSTWFRNTGVVLRNQLGDRETYLHLIAGSNHEHYDHDSGSVVIWGKGRVLADDWGYIGRHGQNFHSLLSSSAIGGNMTVAECSTQPGFDYVTGTKGAWRRQIGFVKDADPLGPNFFLIRDTHQADAPADWRLWLTTRSDSPAEKSPAFPTAGTKSPADDLLADINKPGAKPAPIPPVRIHAQGATVQGDGDIEFDLFIHQPEKLNLRTETATQNVSVGNRDGKVGPLSLKQTALIGSLAGRGSVAVVVYPRLKTDLPPTVRWHADGRIAQVVSSFGTDYAFLTHKEVIPFDGKSLRPLARKKQEGDLLSYHPEDTDTPSAMVNVSTSPAQFSDVKFPARTLDLHPGPIHPVTAVWRSPVKATVTVKLRLQDGNPIGGDGIDYELRSGSKTVHSGHLDNGGREVAHTTPPLEVAPGSLLRLVILPGVGNPQKGEGGNWWDSTFTELTVRSADGTTWDLVDTILNGKLGADPLADPATICWFVCEGDAATFDPATLRAPKPSFKPDSGNIAFVGTAGAIQLRAKQSLLTLGSAGEIQFGAEKLSVKGQRKLAK